MRAKITADHLERTALVYVRQSTPGQVRDHTESRRRQYGLVDVARELGFHRVETIDDDLGLSGSGFANALYGGPSTETIVEAADITRKNGSPKRIGPFAVPKAMSSTASATLATWFRIHGVNYSISSACSRAPRSWNPITASSLPASRPRRRRWRSTARSIFRSIIRSSSISSSSRRTPRSRPR